MELEVVKIKLVAVWNWSSIQSSSMKIWTQK